MEPERGLAFVNPSFHRVETEALEALNPPRVELVLRQAVGLLLEAYHVINGVWSNYRDSKAPRLFLVPGLRFLRRVEREGGGKVVRRWQIVGRSALARPAPWNRWLTFLYCAPRRIPAHRVYQPKMPHLIFLWG